MPDPSASTRPATWPLSDDVSRGNRVQLARMGVFAAVLTLGYSPVLARLIAHALQSDLHSYIPLVPVKGRATRTLSPAESLRPAG